MCPSFLNHLLVFSQYVRGGTRQGGVEKKAEGPITRNELEEGREDHAHFSCDTNHYEAA